MTGFDSAYQTALWSGRYEKYWRSLDTELRYREEWQISHETW